MSNKRWDIKDKLSEREKVVYRVHCPIPISRVCSCRIPLFKWTDGRDVCQICAKPKAIQYVS